MDFGRDDNAKFGRDDNGSFGRDDNVKTAAAFLLYPLSSTLCLMRILVIGAGAVGGYFGARLAYAGRDVTFLVRERRAEQLRSIGLQVTEPGFAFEVTPRLLLASELAAHPEPYDLILLSTKAYSLAAAMYDFAPAVGPDTAILPLLNGMTHLDALAARFGAQAVLGGSTRISADLDAEGRVVSMDKDLHDLHFGELDKSVTPRIQAINDTLSNAGFDAMLEPDIRAFMWHKWTILSALASITCLLRGSIGAVAAVPYGAQTERAILAESAAIAEANGYRPPAPFLAAVEARLTLAGSDLTASMHRDMMRGAPVEADHILGDLLALAKGIDAPLLRAAYVQLSVYSASLTP
jgi:2-dehydropantoate 2-reductase